MLLKSIVFLTWFDFLTAEEIQQLFFCLALEMFSYCKTYAFSWRLAQALKIVVKIL